VELTTLAHAADDTIRGLRIWIVLVQSSSEPLAIIVQARMGSTRLPGKVLLSVLGRPLLDHLLDRLERVVSPHVTVVATTTLDEDDAIERICAARGVPVHRGSAEDVLDRYVSAAAAASASTVARVTADCPLIDPQIVDRVITTFGQSGCDYASNSLERTYPRGLDVEVLTRRALDEAGREAREPFEREHVTPFIYRHPERFRLCNLANDRAEGSERWTVDTPEDFALVSRIMTDLGDDVASAGIDEVRAVLDAHPDWRRINAHVEQKRLGA
jgi:spore coat polysaccharide biosynthesis protein SpsF